MKAFHKSTFTITVFLILLAVGLYVLGFHKSTDLSGWLPQSGRKVYKISYVSQGQTEPSSAPTSMLIEFKGWLDLNLQCDKEKLLCEVGGRIWPESLKSSQNAFDKEQLSRTLFTFELHSQGLIKNIRMDRRALGQPSVLIIDILRNLNLELPRAPVKNGEIWTASIETLPFPIVSSVSVKSSDRQTATLVQTFQIGQYQAVSGNGSFQLDLGEKDITSFHVRRDLSFQNSFGMQVHNSLNVSGQKVPSLPTHLSEAIAVMPGEPSEMIRETFTHDALVALAKARKQQELLGPSTPKDVLDRLAKAGKDRKSNMPLYRQLKALFTLQPESVDAFKPFLLNHDIDSEPFKMVATALTAAGHENCQNLIREVIASLPDGKRRRRLIPNLAFMDHPSEKSEEFLNRLPQISSDPDLISLGERSLGTMAHKLRSHEPDRAARIYERFSARLAAAETVEQKLHNLAVLGNIGLPQNVNTASRYIPAENSHVRAKAYDSLRHVNASAAKDILIGGLVQETQPLVKETIAEALVYGELNPAQVLKIEEQLRTEKNIRAIKSLLRSLANQKSPGAEDIIRRYQKRCAHPDLCGFVDSLVDGFSSPRSL